MYQFNNELLRMFLACMASGLPQTDQVINTSLQKFILREMRTHANALEGSAHWIPVKRRFMSGSSSAGKQEIEDAEEDDDGDDGPEEPMKEANDGDSSRPTRSNPVLPTLYGQSLILAKSYQGALCMSCSRPQFQSHFNLIFTVYLLHAYDYFPNDPLICMTLAVASLGRAMQRQADNRNFLITQVRLYRSAPRCFCNRPMIPQAMGFMSKYRALRGPGDDDPKADEIEYNFGRAFHQIGSWKLLCNSTHCH